jgi:hypothetical protein
MHTQTDQNKQKKENRKMAAKKQTKPYWQQLEDEWYAGAEDELYS